MILKLAAALGIGLLIGAERERRKGEGPRRSAASIRTFTVASLAGAISVIVGGQVLLAVATARVVLLTAAAYWRGHDADPGLTTEIALIVTTLLGGLSMQKPALAAGLAGAVIDTGSGIAPEVALSPANARHGVGLSISLSRLI